METKEKVLITGGAGFIGCAISDLLVNAGHSVVAFDNLHPQIHERQERPLALNSGVELIVGDVTDAEAWDRLLASFRPTLVYHLAAETGTGQSLLEATRHGSVNVVGTTQMTDAFARHSLVPKSIVLASSRAVYGEGAWRDDAGSVIYPGIRTHAMLSNGQWEPAHEEGGHYAALPHAAARVKASPTSIYGATKLAQEHILMAWCSAMGVDLKILRLQNVYGVGQSPINPYTGIITLFHRMARKGQAIPVYEDGEIVRDFVYISDVARALIRVAATEGSGETIDVGTGRPVTIMEAAKTIAALHGAPAPFITGQFRDGDVRSAVADTSELSKCVDVGSFVSFDQGAKLVGEWLVEKGYA
ncbi:MULTISPECIES: SDR family NAD(P)-dependent oxidoreductase [unclassified Pseudoxanthomonas]|uniref:NAD-dependent epimerase/dehydratase family protein n=1 Tax=unclassified Pseudoxanthomonas TaxID=2645906 RepID=UPI003077B29D